MVGSTLEVVVTGANGFVGLEVLRALQEHWKEIPLKAFVRREPEHRLPGVTYVLGELPDEIPELLFEADRVILIHCASLVKGSDLAGYRRVNVEGTRRLLERAGARLLQVIYTSSMSVYGQGPFEGIRESGPRRPETDLALSRSEAELVVTEFMARLRRSAFILRPRFLFGIRDRETLPGLVKLSNSWLRLGSERQQLSFIMVEDFAQIILRLCQKFHTEERREIINVAYPRPIELGNLLHLINPRLPSSRPYLPVKLLLWCGPSKLRTKLQLIGQSQFLNTEKLQGFYPEINSSDELTKLARVIAIHTGDRE